MTPLKGYFPNAEPENDGRMAYQKGVIFLSTQGDIQPLNELRRTCQSRPIRLGQSTCDPRDMVTVGG